MGQRKANKAIICRQRPSISFSKVRPDQHRANEPKNVDSRVRILLASSTREYVAEMMVRFGSQIDDQNCRINSPSEYSGERCSLKWGGSVKCYVQAVSELYAYARTRSHMNRLMHPSHAEMLTLSTRLSWPEITQGHARVIKLKYSTSNLSPRIC